jgi:hypothetical protein
LDRATNFFVSTDNGVDLSGSCNLSEITGIFLKGLIPLLGGGAVGFTAIADF